MQHVKNIKLLENRLILKRIKDSVGIEIPDGTGAAIEHFKGEVVCVGEDCKKIKLGDTVLYRDGYNTLKVEGEEYHIARESNIVGIIDHAKES